MESILRFARSFALAPFDRHNLQYSPVVLTEEVKARLSQHFFPHGIDHNLDLTSHSPYPERFIQEIRRLFLEIHEDIQSLHWNLMLQSMHAVVVAHCRSNPHIQSLGNSQFRLALCTVFNAESNAYLPQELRDCVESDRASLQHARDAVDILCSAEKMRQSRADFDHDSLFSAGTRANEVAEMVMCSHYNIGYGPLTLLEWDPHTEHLVEFLFAGLFAFADPQPVESINRPPTGQSEWQAEVELYDMLLAHFGGQSPTKAEVYHELKLASSGICVDYLSGPILSYLRRKIHSLCLASGSQGGAGCCRGGERHDRSDRIPIFPCHVQLWQTDWSITFKDLQTMQLHSVNFTQENYGASFEPFLATGEMPDLTFGKRQRIAEEANRCLFIHLGAALNIHPVYLQEHLRPRVRDCLISNHFCRGIGHEPLADCLEPHKLIDVNFLISVWPDFLRGVRLLIVNCRGFYGEDDDPDMRGLEKIEPETWTIIGDPAGADREIVLKLSGNHFTLLRPTDPTETQPIRRLQRIADHVGFTPPQDISRYILGPFEGVIDEESQEFKAARELALLYDAIEDSP